jgi:hypothetical protein
MSGPKRYTATTAITATPATMTGVDTEPAKLVTSPGNVVRLVFSVTTLLASESPMPALVATLAVKSPPVTTSRIDAPKSLVSVQSEGLVSLAPTAVKVCGAGVDNDASSAWAYPANGDAGDMRELPPASLVSNSDAPELLPVPSSATVYRPEVTPAPE